MFLGDRLSKGIELLKKLSRVKVVATDVDGTLTYDRKSYMIPIEVIEAIRALRKNGVKVILVSANGFPILVGFGRYVGIDGVVAENGCIVTYMGDEHSRVEAHYLCREGTRDFAKIVLDVLGDELQETWQNDFRMFDFALVTRERKEIQPSLLEAIRELAEKYGYSNRVKIFSSGYAIHITPVECSKLLGLQKLLSLINIDMDEVVGIGDSVMDVDFVRAAGISVAVANADDDLKEAADIITNEGSGYGFAELAKTIIDAKQIDLSKY